MKESEQFHQQLVTFSVLINEKIMKQFVDTYKERMTTTQFFMVAVLGNYGPLSMSALADKLGVQKQQATKIANQLVNIGFVQRFNDHADRRIIRVDLTQKAREYMKKYSDENMERVGQSLSTLKDSEFLELRSAIETINRILPHIDGKSKQNSGHTEGSGR